MKRNWKVMVFWLFGALSLLIGSMIAGNLQLGLGVSTSGFFVALLIAFVFFLVGGLLWIIAGTGAKKIGEV